MSFDALLVTEPNGLSGLNPFRTGLCLSTSLQHYKRKHYESQSLSNRAMSFDHNLLSGCRVIPKSQSLSNRAMSFDQDSDYSTPPRVKVSIPFEQGYVFRQNMDLSTLDLAGVSIPFEQGYVFRPSTRGLGRIKLPVSIPFEQGYVFRLLKWILFVVKWMSQSLSNRAMSFDTVTTEKDVNEF